MKTIEIFCDGSGTTWDNAAGYGFVLVINGEFHSEGYGYIPQGSNNDAEIAAAIKGMMAAKEVIVNVTSYSIKLCSDSQLCLGWASGRYRHKDVNRSKTVAFLQGLLKELQAEPVWVKGHSGHQWNTRADALAHKGRTGKFKLKRDRLKEEAALAALALLDASTND